MRVCAILAIVFSPPFSTFVLVQLSHEAATQTLGCQLLSTLVQLLFSFDHDMRVEKILIQTHAFNLIKKVIESLYMQTTANFTFRHWRYYLSFSSQHTKKTSNLNTKIKKKFSQRKCLCRKHCHNVKNMSRRSHKRFVIVKIFQFVKKYIKWMTIQQD